MKTRFLPVIGIVCLLLQTFRAQNTFPEFGKVGIGTPAPGYPLEVRGDALFTDTLYFKGKLKIGVDQETMTMKFVPGNDTFPGMFKFSAPKGSKPINSSVTDGGIAPEDSQPNLTCLKGEPIPGFLNSFSHMLSVTYNPTNSAVTGGQLLIGHNGVNAFLETQGTGANIPTNSNHPGDLFLNKFCNRNVMFFSHATPFGVGLTNIASIDGSLNVRTKVQIGVSGTSFSEPQSKLYIYSSVGSLNHSLKIKHGAAANYGVQIATFNGATALLVNNGSSSGTDGPESFRIEGDGQTTITTNNTDAFLVRNASSGLVNFKVRPGGTTIVGHQTSAPNAALLNVNLNGGSAIEVFDQNTTKVNFKVRANGYVFCREVNVLPANLNFPDYVFEKNYPLVPIATLETYVRENKHLPNIPSALEIRQDGLNLADMQVKQMEKIEEAFLYIIQLKKEIDMLQQEIRDLKSK